MKLKLDEQNQAVLEDGKPVYVNDDGTEKPVDVAAMAASLTKANSEAAKHRTAAATAKDSLSRYGDLDPEEARKAIAYKAALGDKIDPEQVTHQLATLESDKAGLTTQVETLTAEKVKLGETVDSLTFNAQITGSKFIAEKVNPALREPGLFRAAYGANLDRDDSGSITVKDAAGNTIMSEANAGQPATLDEALPRIVTNPDHLAAGNPNGPGGKDKGNGRPAPTSGEWDKLSRKEMVDAIREHGTLEKAQAAHA